MTKRQITYYQVKNFIPEFSIYLLGPRDLGKWICTFKAPHIALAFNLALFTQVGKNAMFV